VLSRLVAVASEWLDASCWDAAVAEAEGVGFDFESSIMRGVSDGGGCAAQADTASAAQARVDRVVVFMVRWAKNSSPVRGDEVGGQEGLDSQRREEFPGPVDVRSWALREASWCESKRDARGLRFLPAR